MANVFFNTNIIYDNKPCLESVADKCLSPVRCLFNGRDIKNFQVGLSYPNRSAGQVALAIVLFIPAIIFGTLAKLFSLIYSQTRQQQTIVKSLDHFMDLGAKMSNAKSLQDVDLGEIFRNPLLEQHLPAGLAGQVSQLQSMFQAVSSLDARPADRGRSAPDFGQQERTMRQAQEAMEQAQRTMQQSARAGLGQQPRLTPDLFSSAEMEGLMAQPHLDSATHSGFGPMSEPEGLL